MKLIIKKRLAYETSYSGKGLNPGSYWDAKEIVADLTILYHYMKACCEDE
jgi:hypothetical protein